MVSRNKRIQDKRQKAKTLAFQRGGRYRALRLKPFAVRKACREQGSSQNGIWVTAKFLYFQSYKSDIFRSLPSRGSDDPELSDRNYEEAKRQKVDFAR